MNPTMATPRFQEPSFTPFRRLSIGASVLLSILAVVALAGIANYLAQFYAPRFYWGASRDYRLSPLTLGALQGQTNLVRITVFFDHDHPLYPSVRALLREYASASRYLQIEELDYTANPTAAQEFRRQFPIAATGEEPDLVLFESGGRTKAIPARDLRDYDTAAIVRGEPEAKPVAFKGELLFTSAINAVCEGRRRNVFFLRGHREHDFESDAPQTGYRQLAATLEEDNIQVSGLTLTGSEDVPRDCELLVVAGARDPLAAGELQAIERYLRRGGRLLALFQYRANSGLERLLSDWGLQIQDNLVEDRPNSDNGVMIVSRFGDHPVTRPLANSRVYMYLPRAIEGQQVANILGAPAKVDTLLRSGTNGVIVSAFASAGPRYSPDDRRGEIPLAVAVERGALPGVAASLGTTRIVAVGDSTFLANRLIQLAGNRHFAASTINWLLDRSHLLGGIQSAPIRTYQVSMSPFEKRMLLLLLLGVLPGTALALGFVVWWRRH